MADRSGAALSLHGCSAVLANDEVTESYCTVSYSPGTLPPERVPAGPPRPVPSDAWRFVIH